MTYTQKAIEKRCAHCGKIYILNPQYSQKQIARSKFCSRPCQAIGRNRVKLEPWNKGKKYRKVRKCDECNKVSTEVVFYTKFQMTLCHKHYWHMRKYGNILWHEHPPYKTPAHRRIRNSLVGIRWRESVFKRDSYTCQQCGIIGGKLNAHHVKPYAYFPELRYILSNGLTLCVPCHRKTDTWGRKGQKLYAQL